MDGTPFGRYRLIELLGRGGMGEVWRAHDTVTDRIVAIKVLPAHLSEDEDFQRRFRREAHAAARLDTPHVVPIYDYGEIDGRLFVSMRLIKGRDLQAVLAHGPLDPARAVRIIEGVALALHAAHQVGLVHRDVKPSNILLDENDFAYLIDFGIARALDETRMTQSGNTIGTFAYIAPERLDTGTEDARADIYSLACVLYESLTGQPPFPGSTTHQLITAHLNTPPPRPSTSRPAVPAQMDPVIATGMAKDPDNRYATTVELADAARDAITTPLAPPSEPTMLADPTQPATEQRPPGWPTVPPLRPADRPPPDTRTPPRRRWWRRQAIVIPAALLTVAVIGVIAAAIAITSRQQENSNGPQITPPSGIASSPAPTGPIGAQRLTAELKAPNGAPIAAASFDFINDRATVTVETMQLGMLIPGFHGLQIHAVGRCEPNSVGPTGGLSGDFNSAGGVYQAPGHTGLPASGDLGQLKVASDGSAKLVITTEAFTAYSLLEGQRTAVVITEVGTDKRVACGVITD